MNCHPEVHSRIRLCVRDNLASCAKAESGFTILESLGRRTIKRRDYGSTGDLLIGSIEPGEHGTSLMPYNELLLL